ncbi:hypothetical protein Pmani_031974 [Petrolisthes manimaculis]|uniref:Zinc finger protein-like 1 homolog n=1 Tax=Petrolisthes manimaculis TaxID=1843537 RepID=A0AAE1NSM2_9EUCA|nr:hypothetical protein Pmani_031974 [Petrolisthes manimaculis]
MGLCKCPKKKVTNQFCFEHRVNVCEHCLVEEHSACIVQSYLQWLNASEYDPVCKICGDQLASRDCIRLVCYDVFHKDCLITWASRLPPNTAPAGYKCPVCSKPVFPAANLVSPVADCLREALAAYPWARTGLDLPLIEDDSNGSSQLDWSSANGTIAREWNNETPQPAAPATPPRPLTPATDTHPRTAQTHGSSNSSGLKVTAMEDPALTHSQHREPHHHHPDPSPDTPSMTRKASTPDTRLLLPTHEDADDGENKYKRRSAVEWFTRWWRTMNRPASRHHQRLTPGVRRMVIILTCLAVITILVVLSYFSKGASDSDPMLDPFNNPNIHVEGQQ